MWLLIATYLIILATIYFLFTLLKRYPNVMFNVNADCSYGYLTHDFNNANLVISGSNSDSGSLLLKMKRYCSNICEYLTELHNADALVTIGGSLYMENENRTLRAVVAEKRRFFRDKRNARKAAKYYVLGANFGPFYSKRYLSFYKKFFSNYCQDVCFRDRYSASLFSDVSNVRYAPGYPI
ncbi:MAG: polysaccharide pyruvyl transferase family protein [Bifidobacterium pseudocatenulatum]